MLLLHSLRYILHYLHNYIIFLKIKAEPWCKNQGAALFFSLVCKILVLASFQLVMWQTLDIFFPFIYNKSDFSVWGVFTMTIKMTYCIISSLLVLSVQLCASAGPLSPRPHSKTEEIIEQQLSTCPDLSSRNVRALSLPDSSSSRVRQMARQLESKISLPGSASSAVLTQNPLRQSSVSVDEQARRSRVAQMGVPVQGQVELPVIRRSSSATKTAVQLAQTHVALVQASARNSKDVVVEVLDDQHVKSNRRISSLNKIKCCRRKKKSVIDERATEEALLADLQAEENSQDPMALLSSYRKSLAGSLMLNMQLRAEVKEAIEERKTLNQSNRLKTIMKLAAVAALIADRANAYWPTILYAVHYIGL